MFLLLGNNNLYSQQCIEVLKTKLPNPDRYKVVKAMSFMDQGNTFLSKATSFSGTNTDSSSLKNKDKLDDAYYTNRIKASYCFRNSNGLLYDVFDRNIKDFWKEFKGDKKTLEIVVKIENSAYDSLIIADSLREIAEKQLYVEDIIPLVTKAETIEQQALLRIEKVLYTYVNWPEQANVEWLLSEDINIPDSQNLLSNTEFGTDTLSPIVSDKNLQLAILETKPESKNEFNNKIMPGEKALENIDFSLLNDMVIDSVHKQWHKESVPVKINAGTGKTIDFNENAVNLGLSVSDTIYSVQIAACRTRMSQDMLKDIYQGTEKIVETYEDDWFKYTIGKFNTYKEADDLKSKIKVNEPFIVIYLNGIRIWPENN